jgi:murein L,D-transpeptidase YafK
MIHSGIGTFLETPGAVSRQSVRAWVAVALALSAGSVSDAQNGAVAASSPAANATAALPPGAPPLAVPSALLPQSAMEDARARAFDATASDVAVTTVLASVAPTFADTQSVVRDTVARLPFGNATEAGLAKALQALSDKSLKDALAELDIIIKRHPNFRLAHLMRGDLMMAKSGRPVAFAQSASLKTDPTSVAPLAEEAKVRMARYFDHPPEGHVPQELLSLGPWQQYALLVDLDRSRIYVFGNRNGLPTYVTDFYVSMGKNGPAKQREGDQKTPIGVYFVTESRNKLPDFYGPGAFPISYPNEWDRIEEKSGHGIWLHGTPSDTYSRPPRATDGCVVLTNDDLKQLARYVQVGYTPVIITRSTRWLPADEWQVQRDGFSQALDDWRRDWESRDTERYLNHYSRRFRADGRNFDAWAQHKRNVSSGKTFVKVGVDNLSAYSFRGHEDMISVTFEQNYQSSNLSTRMWKRQYWVREGNAWKIVYEGTA